MITIRHTRAEGTLAEGTSRGDGSNIPLKAAGFRWSRQLSCWYLPQSRDRAAHTWKIDRAAEGLRGAGFKVTTEVDNLTPGRTTAEVEADAYDRAGRRADYHDTAAGNASARSDAAFTRDHEILDAIPFGQPILVGHHSERRHRRDLERAESLRRRGMAEADRAEHHADRAAAAEQYQARRENIPTTLRRIKKLEADERSWLRTLDGREEYYTGDDGKLRVRRIMPGPKRTERINAELAAIRDQLEYWREHVKQAEASGVKVWSRDDFTRGDFVHFLYSWYEVLRVNAKSLTIPAMISDGHVVTRENSRMSWTDTVPYDKVKGRRSAEEMAAILAEADRREAEQAAS